MKLAETLYIKKCFEQLRLAGYHMSRLFDAVFSESFNMKIQLKALIQRFCKKERITFVILSSLFATRFERATFRLGEESSLKKYRKGAAFHTTIFETHSLTHSPVAAVMSYLKSNVCSGGLLFYYIVNKR